MSAVGILFGACASLSLAGVGAAAAPPTAPASAYEVVTHATVQAAGRLRFALASFRLVRGMAGTPGLIRQRQGIRRFGAEVWTATAWQDRAAMLAFVRGGAHRAAMRDAAHAIVTMSAWHLDCPPDAMPQRFEEVIRLHDGALPPGCRVRDPAAMEPPGGK